MVKVPSSPILKTQLRELLARGGNSDAIERGLQQLVDDTGASGAELRAALEELQQGALDPAQLSLWKAAVSDFATASSNPRIQRGQRAHDVKAAALVHKKPWYAGVKTELAPALHQTPPRDVTVGGQVFTKDDVASLLRGIGKDLHNATGKR